MGPPGRAELLKVATVRGLWLGAVLATACPAAASRSSWRRPAGSAWEDTVTSGAATGSVAGLLAFGVWAATLAAGEYAHQTIIVSLATVPRRSCSYGAKVAATASVAAGGALVSVVAAWLVAWP